MSVSRAGGLDLERIRARLPGGSHYRASLVTAEADIVYLVREVEALRTALRPFAERAEWTIASTPGERLPEVTDDDVLPVPWLACRRAAAVVGAPERDL